MYILGCALPTDSDLQMRQRCFAKKQGSSGTTLSEFDKKALKFNPSYLILVELSLPVLTNFTILLSK